VRAVPRTRVVVVLILVVACAAVLLRAGGWLTRPVAVRPAAEITAADDAGDKQATTTFDGPMVRRRAAIGIHPVKGADRTKITAELTAMARTAKIGPLEPSTFAVFSSSMLEFLVPEMTLVAPEGVSVESAEAMMRDHQPADVAFYLVQPVLVHDVTFAVIPAAGVDPASAAAIEDREGILTDDLGKYTTSVQRTGVTVRYFGAILSDAAMEAVCDAMARAAKVPDAQVQISPNEPFAGVDLSGSAPLTDDESTHHHH
jgi:HAMP domain-containing protein